MSVKVIVTDMDGTFLNDVKTYNQPRFMAQYQELKKRGIEFVVASGNQYYQLISFFPELKDEISFVAENGALVYEHGKQLFHGELTRHESRIVIGELLKISNSILSPAVCKVHMSAKTPPKHSSH